jgi:hypothetical protein
MLMLSMTNLSFVKRRLGNTVDENTSYVIVDGVTCINPICADSSMYLIGRRV